MTHVKAKGKPLSNNLMICVLLAAATFFVFAGVTDHAFILYDDDIYLSANPKVQEGLSLKGVGWAFTTFKQATWHPLTWLSHMLDCQLFGLNPGRHHLMNLLLHMASTLLLFLVLKGMTKRMGPSAFAAALFALHPLHVESVAWAAERKDVLSTLFWMLTLWAYLQYVNKAKPARYLLTLLFFTLGLMAKPMLVTLPFVLLLLDYWPLKRFQSTEPGTPIPFFSRLLGLVWEKAPFFLLSAAFCVVTIIFQSASGAVGSLERLPLDERAANALVACVGYIVKMFWPESLAVLYPHPGMPPLWQIAGAAVVLSSLFLAAVLTLKRLPWFLVGWLWYVGTLVPVIGLVQVGVQAMADRYTYIPLIGLFLIVAWGGAHLLERWLPQDETRVPVFIALACTILLPLAIRTRAQVKHWENSITLFEHTVNVTKDNWVGNYNLGLAYAQAGRPREAIPRYLEALRIRENLPSVHNNLGLLLSKQGEMEAAIHHFKEALRINPGHYTAHNNLGIALCREGKVEEALHHFREALRIHPGFTEARNNLRIVSSRKEMNPLLR